MTDASRFDQFHVKAGSPTGGQFATSSGGGGGAKAPAVHGHATASTGHAAKQRLLTQAHADLAEARKLGAQLHLLEKQHAAAVAAAKKSAAAAKKSKHAGHVVHHHHHAAQHRHHTRHAATLTQRITSLKTRIHDLRSKAAALEHQAHAMRADITTGRAAMASSTKAPAKPYGDVTYADPKNGKYPVDTEEHARAAWSYINMPKNAAQYPMNGVTLSEVKGRIMAACKKFGIDVSGDGDSGNGSASRSELMRDYPLEDLHIVRSADGGDGRTVEAFAAVFNTETEIMDHQGHYIEVISPSAFNKRLSDLRRSKAGFSTVKVTFNHGRDSEGNLVERFQMPVAKPLSIEATDRGLLTRSRYFDTPLGNEVLQLISEGGITAQSFEGKIVRSDPQLGRHGRYRPDSSGRLTTVHRTELGLRQYGGVLFPAYEGADVLGVRMSTPGTWEPDEEFDPGTSPDGEAAAGEPLATDEHSARYHQHALYRMTSEELRKKAGLVW